MERIRVVILAGGQSRRMGHDKASLPFGGGTFLTHLVNVYQATFPVSVSVARRGQFDTAGAEEIADLVPGQGPLAGLQAAFRQTDADIIFFTATDLPFGSPALAEALLSLLGEHQAAVIRRSDGKIEPLFAAYRRSVLPDAEENLAQGRRALSALLEKLDVRWIDEDELAGFDLNRALDNLNTPEDYHRAVEK